MDSGRKRGRQDAAFSGNGGFKRAKEEMDSYTGVGSKSKPCTKFFSTSGCAFGDSCHFLHYFPGYSAHTQLANVGGRNAVPGRNVEFPDGPAPTMKTKMCNRINTPEGCRFGDKCHFAHSEMELAKSNAPVYEDPRSLGPMGLSSRWHESSPHGISVGSFGASATAKISIDSSFAGPIIGKNGANSKQICRQTGVKLSIRDHETDPNQRNIELEGTLIRSKKLVLWYNSLSEVLVLQLAAQKSPRVHLVEVAHRIIIRKRCAKIFLKDCALTAKSVILPILPVNCGCRIEQFVT